jgi:putative CocE/NonD family hydrolase
VSSTAVDTDFTVKLTDTAPGGPSEIVQDGIFRMRYRESRCKARLIKPGHVYCISVEIGNVAHRFDAGHQLKIIISSSNFPKFDRNLNMPQNPETATCWITSKQEIFWGGLRASFLQVPVMDVHASSTDRSGVDSFAGQRANAMERRLVWK